MSTDQRDYLNNLLFPDKDYFLTEVEKETNRRILKQNAASTIQVTNPHIPPDQPLVSPNQSIHLEQKNILDIPLDPEEVDNSLDIQFLNYLSVSSTHQNEHPQNILSSNNTLTPQTMIDENELQINAQYIKDTVIALGLPPLGNLFSSSLSDVSMTITSLYAFIKICNEHSQYKNNSEDKMRRLEMSNKSLELKIESCKKEKLSISSQLGRLENEIKRTQGEVAKGQSKLKTEKEEWKQNILKSEQKISSMNIELKKREIEYNKFKQQLAKTVAIDKSNVKNAHYQTQLLNKSGLKIYDYVGEKEMALMLKQGYEATQQALIEENNQLKQCLSQMQEELRSIIIEKIQEMQSYEKLSTAKIQQFEIIQIKPVIFDTQISGVYIYIYNIYYMTQVIGDIFQIFQENFKRLNLCCNYCSRLIKGLPNEN